MCQLLLSSHFDLGFIELFAFETLPLDDIQISQMKESVLSCCLLSLDLLWSPLSGKAPPLTQMPGMSVCLSVCLLSLCPFNRLFPLGPSHLFLTS